MIISKQTESNGGIYFDVWRKEQALIGTIERDTFANPNTMDYFWRFLPWPDRSLSADELLSIGAFVQSLNAKLLMESDQ